jgi:hypothetical protein
MQITDPYTQLTAGKVQSNAMDQFGIKELLNSTAIDREAIKKVFAVDPDQFEELLFRIHYKRKKELPAQQRANILDFLSTGYLITDDVRYFNEFLWFYEEHDSAKGLMDDCMQRFNANLDEKGRHRMIKKLSDHPVDMSGYDLRDSGDKKNERLKICLIGFPPFFGKMIKQLRKEGHHVEQFFLPYHPNKKISGILKLKLPVRILSLLSGNPYSYRTLDLDHKDERIGQVLKEGNFDIGFHKLNFIIRENIFGAFKQGLLNDHWGYLPMLRGKSTIAWSVLLGVPVIPTIHFISSGIDQGPIAGYYPLDYNRATNTKEIKNIIRKKMPERAIAAIKHAGSSFIPKENASGAGVTFYDIHPWLDEHIASRVLVRKD